ncbi:MAG: DUF5325 family protein [Alicyclobacillaceae bacterium]|nr:DUF5325 family protein [Alicyclobacillaceae bacterium]
MTSAPNRSPGGIPRKYRPAFLLLALAAMFCFALVGQSLSAGHFARAGASMVAGLLMVGIGFMWRSRLLR